MSEVGDLEKTSKEDNWSELVSVAPNQRSARSSEAERISFISENLRKKGVEVPAWILRDFSDPALYPALPEYIRDDQELFSSYIENTAKFSEIIHTELRKRDTGDKSGLFGSEESIPASLHANGRERREESGYRVNPEYLHTVGIDPRKVLFYRITQPSDTPKPEYYWTSDFHEVVAGLHAEVRGEQRKNAVVLVADLQTINENEGLIQDINDDQGLPVRQIGLGPFDQKKSLAVFRPDDFRKADKIRTEISAVSNIKPR